MRKLLGIGGLLLCIVAASWFWKTEAFDPLVTDQTVDSDSIGREERSLRDLSVRSDLIVTGRSLDRQVKWINGGRVLVTLVTVEVDDLVKGSAESKLTVVLPGGEDSNRKFPVAMTYPGAPTIMPDEEVFLFLNKDDTVKGGYAVAGFAEGKFSIVTDKSGNKLVSRDLIRERAKTRSENIRETRRFSSVDDFKGKIKEILVKEEVK
ncbi:MAG: hypothetical protein WBD22_13765 [Pyrinomonadaceae bacterium]